jgi:hypothetical protein
VPGDEPQGRLLGLFHVLGVFDTAEPERQLLPGECREVTPVEEIPCGETTCEVIDRCALHHRVVDVEERRNSRISGDLETGFDLGGCGRGHAGLDRATTRP